MKSNKWYSENDAKNHSLKLNIYIHSQSIVNEGRAGSTSLNLLSTRPVHIPSSWHQILWKVSPENLSQYQTVSTSTLPLQGDSSLRCGQCQGSKDLTASWWATGIWSKTLPHLIPGDRSYTHPQPAGLWDEGREKCRAHPRGCSEHRVTRDWTIQSPAGHASLTVLLISNSEE